MRIRAIATWSMLACLLLAGCASSPSITQRGPAAGGVQAAPSAIPWDRVGPGWLLATWNRNRGAPSGTRDPGTLVSPINSIFLVDPEGGRYLVARFANNNVTLSGCAGASSTQRLFKVAVRGGAPVALTALPLSAGPDAGDLNAWAVGSIVYVQDAGGCGYEYLAKLQPNQRTTPVTVPGVARGDSVFVLGVANG